MEALIQELPKFRLKAVPTDCSECPICLEEFHVGNEVKYLPSSLCYHLWIYQKRKCGVYLVIFFKIVFENSSMLFSIIK